MTLIRLIIATALSVTAINAYAVVLPPVPTAPIYFEPPVVEAESGHLAMNCYQLDKSIRELSPYRYSYKPDFYQDDANQMATMLVMVDTVPIVKGLFGLVYLNYSALVEEKEQRRVLLVEKQISMLQQLKAEKHCFE